MSHRKPLRPEDWVPLGVTLGAASIAGKRGLTEDAYKTRVWNEADGPIGYACVCDGHGDGGDCAEFVAKNLSYALGKEQDTKEWDQRCQDACHLVDEQLKTKHKKGGTTAIFTLITKHNIIVANVGDSRCILVQQGETKQEDLSEAMANLSLEGTGSFTVTALSKDHSIDGAELERLKGLNAKIEAETYKNVLGEEVTKTKWVETKLAMSRAFGDFEHKDSGLLSKPDVVVRDRSSRDAYLVLACDGVWDVKSNEEIGRMVIEEMSNKPVNEQTLTEAADRIAKACVDSNDNITLIILSLQSTSSSSLPSPDPLPAPSNVETPQKK